MQNETEGEEVGCPACSGRTRFLFSAKDVQQGCPGTFMIYACETCGTGVTLPIVTEGELGKYYPPRYYTHRPPRGVVALLGAVDAWRFDRQLGLDRLKPGKLLEIGPGDCSLLLRMKARGWVVTGLDPDPLVVEAGRSLGLDMSLGAFSKIGGGPFDLVIAWQSLEHSVSPRDDVQRLAAYLKPGGRLIVGVPDFGSRIARHFRDAWFHLDPPRHRTHFTREGLAHILSDTGLEVRFLRSWLQPYALLGSWRFKRGGRPVRFLDAVIARVLMALPASALQAMGRGDLIAFEAIRGDQ